MMMLDLAAAAIELCCRIRRVCDPCVAEVFQLLEDQQPRHQPNRFGRSAEALAVMFGKGLIQLPPGDCARQAEQGIIRIELLKQIGAE